MEYVPSAVTESVRAIVSRAAVMLALVLLVASPAAAHELTVAITADCGCTYAVTVTGNTAANAQVTVNYSFDVTEGGITYHVASKVETNADANGNFAATVDSIPLPNACKGLVQFPNTGKATLIFNGITSELVDRPINTPGDLFCGGNPPPGKSLEIGPSSMEGHLQIRPGDWISGGYSFKFVSASHPDTAVTVSSTLTLPFTCPQGGGSGGEIVINLGTHSYNVPAGNTNWQPTGDANSVLSWAGSGQAPDGCSGNIMDNSKGAIFDATISQSPDTGQLLNWRFKYRDPNAKGKGNVNCLDTSDPRRAKADVCGASWSETVKDP